MAIPGNFLSSVTESIDPNTSGWKVKQNCTLLLGSGGRNGNGCLSTRSVAAGEMQAITVSSYAVTPWTVYEAFCDAAGVVGERIGIRWLNASNAEISITWSMTTSPASSSWHRIAVGGVAPASAARAQVVVSSTPGAGSVDQFYENFYLGFPMTTVGNLFAFNTESAEVDASGWLNEVNCTVSRQAPPVQWAVDNYLAGGHVITLTATANGNVSMRSTDRPDATPGVEYVAHAYLSPPTPSSNAWVELRFYDSVGTQIQATRGTLAPPGTAYYRQRASAVAPAGTASCSIAAGVDSATAGQVLKVDWVVVVSTAPVLYAGSIVPYADASFEQGVAGWTVVSGATTIARTSPWGAYGFDGSYSLAISSATATTSVIRSARFPLPTGATTGQNLRTRVIGQLAAGGWTMTRGARFYDAGNTDLGVSASASVTAPSPGWWELSNDFAIPANATQAAIEYTLTATSTSSTWIIDRVGAWLALPVHSVEAHDDTASITLTLRELTLGELLTIYRVLPDGSRTLVRGPSGLYSQTPITSDEVIVEDYEAPLGVAVSYYIETLTPGSQTPGYQGTDTVTLDPGDRNEAWLKDPGQPQRNLKVLVAKAPDWQRSIEQAEMRVRGRRNSVILSDVRGGLEGELAIWTRSDDERDALHWLLDSGNVLLWQSVPGMGVADMYVTVGQITEARVTGYAPEPWRAWTLPLRQVDMPTTTGVAGSAGRTWQDVLTAFATWQDVLDAYATWEDVLFDRRIGG